MSKVFSVNENIREETVQLVLEDGKMYGQVSIDVALEMASEKKLDLVEVSPPLNGKAAICKLLDYGKLKYKKNKHKKKNKEVVKEIRLSLNISDHDIGFKNKKVMDFLEKKFKVKYVLRLKGGERRHRLEAQQKMDKWLEIFKDCAKWDEVQLFDDSFFTILFPLK